MADDDKDPKPAAKDDAPADSPLAKADAPVLKKDAGDAIVAKQDKAASVPATAKAAAKKPAPPVDEDEDDDDEYEDEDDDEEEDEPPPKPVKKAPIAKAKATPKGKAAPKGKVAARIARPVRRLRVGHYLPWAFGGMALVGAYVAWYPERSYAVPAVLGIAISVWAYIGIGSVNEIKA